MEEQLIYDGKYSVEELEDSIGMFCQYKKVYLKDVANGYRGTFKEWLSSVTNRTVRLMETEWNNIESNPTLLQEFCNKYDGWNLDVVEDYDIGTWKFGDKFPIKFSGSIWAFGDSFPIVFT